MEKRVKAWINDAEKSKRNGGEETKKGGRLHTAWASRGTKIKELKLENKKLKAKVQELKGSGDVVSTSPVGAHAEEASVLHEYEGKKRRAEFERLAQEKTALTNERDDLQRRLKDAEGDKARAQRSHAKELAHATELSEQTVKCADLTGHARSMGEAHRPRGTFNTPSPQSQDDGSLKGFLGMLPSQ